MEAALLIVWPIGSSCNESCHRVYAHLIALLTDPHRELWVGFVSFVSLNQGVERGSAEFEKT